MIENDGKIQWQPDTMSLRDWLAGQAPSPGIDELAYFIGADESTPREPYELTAEQRAAGVKCVRDLYRELTVIQKLDACARYKFAHADAMLKARGVPNAE